MVFVRTLFFYALASPEVSALRLNAGGTRLIRAEARPIDIDDVGQVPATYSSLVLGDSSLSSFLTGPTSLNASNFPVASPKQLSLASDFGNALPEEEADASSAGPANVEPVAVVSDGGISALAAPVNADSAPTSTRAEVADANASVALGNEHLRRQLIVAKYDEDVSWLKGLPAGMDVAVYQSKDPKGLHFVDNYGNEASKYLSYILDNYDDLPDFMTFVQAGRQDWHDPLPKDTTLAHWRWDTAAERGGMAYLPTAAPCLVEDTVELPVAQALDAAEEVQRQRPQCNGVTEHHPKQMTTLLEVWEDVFEQELGAMPHRWVSTCCAQFEVTREAVRRHPESFYRKLFDWVMVHDRSLIEADNDGAMRRNHDPERRDAGHVMEVAWVLLFSDGDEILPDLASSQAD